MNVWKSMREPGYSIGNDEHIPNWPAFPCSAIANCQAFIRGSAMLGNWQSNSWGKSKWVLNCDAHWLQIVLHGRLVIYFAIGMLIPNYWAWNAALLAIVLWGLRNWIFSQFFHANWFPIALHWQFLGFAIALQGNAMSLQILLLALLPTFIFFGGFFLYLNYRFYATCLVWWAIK
jgi:hypothetical protein